MERGGAFLLVVVDAMTLELLQQNISLDLLIAHNAKVLILEFRNMGGLDHTLPLYFILGT